MSDQHLARVEKRLHPSRFPKLKRALRKQRQMPAAVGEDDMSKTADHDRTTKAAAEAMRNYFAALLDSLPALAAFLAATVEREPTRANVREARECLALLGQLTGEPRPPVPFPRGLKAQVRQLKRLLDRLEPKKRSK